MTTETKPELPLIRWDVVTVGDRQQELVIVGREKGRGFACAADTREKAWEGVVKCMAQAMDSHMATTGVDPANSLAHGPTADGADTIPCAMARRVHGK